MTEDTPLRPEIKALTYAQIKALCKLQGWKAVKKPFGWAIDDPRDELMYKGTGRQLKLAYQDALDTTDKECN